MVHLALGLMFFFVAIIVVVKRYKAHKAQFSAHDNTTIPGLPRGNSPDGNLEEIEMAGSLSLFLREMHNKYGPIVSFWEGSTFAVSCASPELFEEQKYLFNLPDSFGDMFRPLCGDECFAVSTGERAEHYRKLYDPFFTIRGINTFYECAQEVADEFVDKWNGLNSEDQIPLMETMSQATMKSLLLMLFGSYFRDEDKMERIRTKTEEIFAYLQIPPMPDSDDEKYFKEFIKTVHKIIHHVIDLRRDDPIDEDRPVFLDILLEEHIAEEQRIGDALLFLTAGYTTTGQLLTNVLYMLSINEEVQEKVYRELKEVLDEQGHVTPEILSSLRYTRQVLDETLRYIPAADFLFRTADEDHMFGGHSIPKGTNLYQALCVCFDDPNIFQDPDRYDPDRFSQENSQHRHPYAFKPFGFGSRQCPGSKFTYILATIFLAEWCRNFQFSLVPGQSVTFIHGFITKPADEIWLTVEPRKINHEKINLLA